VEVFGRGGGGLQTVADPSAVVCRLMSVQTSEYPGKVTVASACFVIISCCFLLASRPVRHLTALIP
jgi:hypothetical protein